MTQWHEVRDSRVERPDELDTESSYAVVYERRNIRQEERQTESGTQGITTEWVYDQREYTKEEWSQEQAIKRALAIRWHMGGADAATYKEALEVLGVVFEEDAV